MTLDSALVERFEYEGFDLDTERGELRCHYRVGAFEFEETVGFGPDLSWESPAVAAAARWVFLLAGVSYYKTAAPLTVDLGVTATTPNERAFLRSFYLKGLGEFAFRNELDLSALHLVGPELSAHDRSGVNPPPGRPLVPFGGGIDSIVTTEAVRKQFADTALFVVNRPGDRFDAIERPAAVTGLAILRAERQIDEKLLRSAEFGWRNGHVPVTGILSAIAVMAAVLHGRDAVVMSNEWSASIPNIYANGQMVNHQYSKSFDFEVGFASVLAESLGVTPKYFSLLRPFSELWVAQRFAALTAYHSTFRSCNRAFHINQGVRLDDWCGECDKCCFIDLILSPFMAADELNEIFGGREPLRNRSLIDRFENLLALNNANKPFECVGDVDECSAAILLAAARTDRRGDQLVTSLAERIRTRGEGSTPDALMGLLGPHRIPDDYAPQAQLV